MNFNGRRSCCALDVSKALLQGLNTPLSRQLEGLLERGDHVAFLAKCDEGLEPSSYTDWYEFFKDYQAINILSKFPNLDTGIDRAKVALEKFAKSEESCKETYYRLRSLRNGKVPMNDPVHAVINSARMKIENLLGPFSWDRAEQQFGFGPGACIGLRRRNGDSYYKFGFEKPTSTEGNSILAGTAIYRIPRWRAHLSKEAHPDSIALAVAKGNRVTTVPKSAKTDRVIAIEPMMNMFVQKGIGALIRRALKRAGVNLDSQDLNQVLAREGSLDGSLATIDLSMASDTVSLSLVEELLPEDWVSAIKQCRSPVGTLPDGTEILYRKVSSMGNGFTFELESLIFWALASSVMSYLNEWDRRFAIYGDDIIVPTRCAELLIRVLAFVGFKTNKEKTFTSGPFRESCGKHFFLGRDVTPMYIRDDVRTIERRIWLANSLSRLAFRLCGRGYGRDSLVLYAWGVAVSGLPHMFKQPRVPIYTNSGDGPDSWLAGNFDECRPRRARFGLCGYEVKVLQRVYANRRGSGVPQLLKSLHGSERSAAVDSACPRGSVATELRLAGRIDSLTGVARGVGLDIIPLSKYKHVIIRSLVPQWGDAGPWTL